MRILFTSATIAVLSNSSSGASDSAAEFSVNIPVSSQIIHDVGLAYTPKTPSSSENGNRIIAEAGPSSLSAVGAECNSFISRKHADNVSDIEPDVGVLACSQPHQVCIRDEESFLGGRCADRRPRGESQATASPIFQQRRLTLNQRQKQSRFDNNNGIRNGQTSRFLQSSFICPANCPKDFCKCAEKHGNGVDCVKELNDICVDGMLFECVPYEFITYYEETYCPFAACMRNGGKYWECECEFQRDYCNMYYEYVESEQSCEIAACCDLQEGKQKASCIPALAPTATPSSAPTVTSLPTASPSRSSAPSKSLSPSVSSVPSAVPSTSTAPSVSSKPSFEPTEYPTTSTPTKSPSALPSFSPSRSPSTLPSLNPSVSSAPSESMKPSMSPTISTSPTITARPSQQPSSSTAPSKSPSFVPSVSAAPSAAPSTSPPTMSPSTSEPTDAPTNSPTKAPTKIPSKEPTDSPTEQSSTAVPTGASVEVEAAGPVPRNGVTFPPTVLEGDANVSPNSAVEAQSSGGVGLSAWSTGMTTATCLVCFGSAIFILSL
mmetsp:Transcript_11359/g.23944  ORF Transcript_11359/g.23944 Transcript_11359/m.23944 type:complete len:548 (-) Transcript_11359:450-2093(-)